MFEDSTVDLGFSASLLHPFLLSDPPMLSAASALPLFCFTQPVFAVDSSGVLFLRGLRFNSGGSASRPDPASVFPALSGASVASSVPLSPCMVPVLLSLAPDC